MAQCEDIEKIITTDSAPNTLQVNKVKYYTLPLSLYLLIVELEAILPNPIIITVRVYTGVAKYFPKKLPFEMVCAYCIRNLTLIINIYVYHMFIRIFVVPVTYLHYANWLKPSSDLSGGVPHQPVVLDQLAPVAQV